MIIIIGPLQQLSRLCQHTKINGNAPADKEHLWIPDCSSLSDARQTQTQHRVGAPVGRVAAVARCSTRLHRDNTTNISQIVMLTYDHCENMCSSCVDHNDDASTCVNEIEDGQVAERRGWETERWIVVPRRTNQSLLRQTCLPGKQDDTPKQTSFQSMSTTPK